MASNTRKMSTERTTVLQSQWKELEPEFLRAKEALLAAKDRDNMYTCLVAEAKLDKAFDQAEEYGYTMTEANKGFESVRMIIETISPEDADHAVVKDIMATWNPYIETYKKLTRNYCSAHSFRKKRLKEAEDEQRAIDNEDRLKEKALDAEDNLKVPALEADTQLKEKAAEAEARRVDNLAMEELRLTNNLAIKKLEVERAMGGPDTSGNTTPGSRESPVPPAVTQLSKQDISQFKPTNSLSSKLSFLEMQDWKEEVLNWVKIAKHTDLEISMQKHLLKIVVDSDMWLKACYTFEAEDSHIEMIDKLVFQFEISLPLFNRRQQFFDQRRGKSKSLHSYMIKMEHQGLSAKIQDMGVHKMLCHKFMSDEGPAFHKKICGLKTPTGETNHNHTFKEQLNLVALEYRESVMTSESKNKVNQTGGGTPKWEKFKKKEGFIK